MLALKRIQLSNCERPCSYVPEPDDMAVLKIAYQLYCKFNKFPEALRVALRMGNAQVCHEDLIMVFLVLLKAVREHSLSWHSFSA